MVQYSKVEKAAKLAMAMEMLLDGRRPKEVKDMLNLTYQDMVKVGLIDRVRYRDKKGNLLGFGPYICALQRD